MQGWSGPSQPVRPVFASLDALDERLDVGAELTAIGEGSERVNSGVHSELGSIQMRFPCFYLEGKSDAISHDDVRFESPGLGVVSIAVIMSVKPHRKVQHDIPTDARDMEPRIVRVAVFLDLQRGDGGPNGHVQSPVNGPVSPLPVPLAIGPYHVDGLSRCHLT
jgi:hypothetical protein